LANSFHEICTSITTFCRQCSGFLEQNSLINRRFSDKSHYDL
jgi:hypothetical protein